MDKTLPLFSMLGIVVGLSMTSCSSENPTMPEPEVQTVTKTETDEPTTQYGGTPLYERQHRTTDIDATIIANGELKTIGFNDDFGYNRWEALEGLWVLTNWIDDEDGSGNQHISLEIRYPGAKFQKVEKWKESDENEFPYAVESSDDNFVITFSCGKDLEWYQRGGAYYVYWTEDGAEKRLLIDLDSTICAKSATRINTKGYEHSWFDSQIYVNGEYMLDGYDQFADYDMVGGIMLEKHFIYLPIDGKESTVEIRNDHETAGDYIITEYSDAVIKSRENDKPGTPWTDITDQCSVEYGERSIRLKLPQASKTMYYNVIWKANKRLPNAEYVWLTPTQSLNIVKAPTAGIPLLHE